MESEVEIADESAFGVIAIQCQSNLLSDLESFCSSGLVDGIAAYIFLTVESVYVIHSPPVTEKRNVADDGWRLDPIFKDRRDQAISPDQRGYRQHCAYNRADHKANCLFRLNQCDDDIQTPENDWEQEGQESGVIYLNDANE